LDFGVIGGSICNVQSIPAPPIRLLNQRRGLLNRTGSRVARAARYDADTNESSILKSAMSIQSHCLARANVRVPIDANEKPPMTIQNIP